MTVAEQYEQTVEWLERLYTRPHVAAVTARLGRIEFLLEQLDNPHRAFRSVHVAGTAGKGSTTTMIGSVLQAAGSRTGYFRSPHLESYRERIAIDNQVIDEASWIRCFNQVVAVSERMEHGSYPDYRLSRPALFEVLFAMAALYFRQCGLDWAAIETGMGGRLDATNTLRSDVAVVTNISLEHTKVLGNSVEEIAAEKAAIIKRGSDAVTGTQDARALGVIKRRAEEQEVDLHCLDRDFFVITNQRVMDGQQISLSDSAGTFDVRLQMGGDFQALNAATAFGAVRALQRRGIPVSDAHIVRGLEDARVPGRFEIVSTSPVVLLDGAHNPAAMLELRQSLDSFFPLRRIILMFAAMSDKDVEAMAGEIGPRVDVVITTRAPGTDRATPARALAGCFAGLSRIVLPIDEPADALRAALTKTDAGDVLVVAGSLYLVGWARTHLLATGVGI